MVVEIEYVDCDSPTDSSGRSSQEASFAVSATLRSLARCRRCSASSEPRATTSWWQGTSRRWQRRERTLRVRRRSTATTSTSEEVETPANTSLGSSTGRRR